MERRAKLFKTGAAKRRVSRLLSASNGTKFSSGAPKTGDLILSAKPRTWDGFFEALKGVEIPDDFLSPKERKQPPARRNPFEDWVE